MFFKQIHRNAKRSRAENGIYFGSLVVAIVFSYILLSLGEQDVMVFLKTMESDAVMKLMRLIPLVYLLSLFFVFFLVYFASKYQLHRRSREIGMYQMLGMKRSKLFSMLMGETVWNSVVSLGIGIPSALFITELVSLTTAKLIGLGIINHRFRLSFTGLIGTIIGFMSIQILAMFILSFYMSRKEPVVLLKSNAPSSQKLVSRESGGIAFTAGVILLLITYGVAIVYLRSFSTEMILGILIAGIAGTFLLFHGLGSLIGRRVQGKSRVSTGLYTFTVRQLQENVLHQSKSLAIASLLILLAMVCVSFGFGVFLGSGASSDRTTDFSVQGTESTIQRVLDSTEIKPYIASYYPMYISQFSSNSESELGTKSEKGHDLSWSGLRNVVETLPESRDKQELLQCLEDNHSYVISVGSFNQMRQTSGKEQISLSDHEVAFYSTAQFDGIIAPLQESLDKGAFVTVDSTQYQIAQTIYRDNLVADRSITLVDALIIPDNMYEKIIGFDEPFCWNLMLDSAYVESNGLMQAISKVDLLLSGSGLEYDSYLESIGRNLFYTVAASYLTIYLGVLFLIIANTVIGLKFLMQQRSIRRRYGTMLALGAKIEDLCRSGRQQIRMFFGLAIGVAVVSATFGVWAMFTSFLRLPNPKTIGSIITISMLAIILFLLLEVIYIKVIERFSEKEIRSIDIMDRG